MRCGVVVDGYSSGADLVHEFNRLGIYCLHLQSTKEVPDIYAKTFRPEYYRENLIFNDDFDKLTKVIKQYEPIFVVAGSEPGIELADLLANRLNLFTANPSSTSCLRRNKFFMHEQLKASNLAYIRQFKSNSLDEILAWAIDFNDWPLVIKPLKSAGGDRVKICYSKADIIEGFNNIINANPNMLGLIDKEVLIQEYIDATEIAINTVQYEGKSYLCEVVLFNKTLINNGKNIYDYATLIPFESCDTKLIDYAFEVASKLDIKFGPMHAEIFARQDSPVLVEAAARIMGANTPIELMKGCLTHSQLEMTVLAYANPAEFLLKTRSAPTIKKNFRIIFLISKVSGSLKKVNYLDEIKELPSFYGIKLRVKDTIHVTEDYDSSPGLIYICHSDEMVLEMDYKKIRELELNNMYELA